ncbi:MAG: ABC transporter permease [Pseudomonadota bacterium]
MTAFLALIRKDILLFVGDRRALLMSLVMPIVLATFFGYLFGGSGVTEAGKIEVALVLQDDSETGKKIAAALRADGNLKITDMPLEQAQQQVRKGKQKAAVILPAGFGEAAGSALFGAGTKPAIGLLYDPSQQAVLAMVKGMLTQHVMQIVSADMFGGAAGKQLTDKALGELEHSSNPDAARLKDLLGSVQRYQQRASEGQPSGQAGGLTMPFTTAEQALTSAKSEHGYNGYAHSFAGMGVQFILFMGIEIGISILLARRLGIWNRLLAAPVTMRTLLLARAVSGAIIALALLCALFAFAVLVFKVEIANLAGFAGVAIGFALLTASFGLLVAAFGKTPEAARSLAVFATLIMVMLGGAWVPSFLFPPWVQQVALAVPTRWAIDGLDAMTWRGLGMDAAWPAIGGELAFAAVFAILAIWKFGKAQN